MEKVQQWLDKINVELNAFVKTINEEYSCQYGTDFCAYLDNNIIEWTLLVTENSSEAFYANFVSRYPQVKGFSFFLLSLLHEVGHFETEWEMENDTEIRNSDLTDEQYFDLFNERIATDWAGEWILHNLLTAQKVDKQLTALLDDFYDEVLK